jgi:hypothetical protein
MTAHSAIDAQLGVSEESTYGTLVAPARNYAFNSESLALSLERNESKGMRSGQKYDRTDGWQTGKRRAAGSVALEVGNKSFGLLFKHCLGTVATTTDGAGKKHTLTPGDLFGKSLTVQVGRPDTLTGTVNPFSYLGCKVASWGLSQAVDDFLQLNLNLDAQDEDATTGLTAAIAPTFTELFHWSGLVVTVGGSAFDALSFDFTQDNGLNIDRHHLRGSRLKKEPTEAGQRAATGTLQGDFESMTAYNRFVNGTVVPVVATWTCVSTYDTAKPFKLVMTLANVRFDGTTPGVGGPGQLAQPLPFKVIDDAAAPGTAVKIELYTSDVTP